MKPPLTYEFLRETYLALEKQNGGPLEPGEMFLLVDGPLEIEQNAVITSEKLEGEFKVVRGLSIAQGEQSILRIRPVGVIK